MNNAQLLAAAKMLRPGTAVRFCIAQLEIAARVGAARHEISDSLWGAENWLKRIIREARNDAQLADAKVLLSDVAAARAA